MLKTNFERAFSAIEALLPRAKILVTGDVDEMIKTRLSNLSSAYGQGLLNKNRVAIEYGKTTTQIAYCYRALSIHADWITRALEAAGSNVTSLFDDKTINVSCIGGGPGSDLLGVVNYALSLKYSGEINFRILDKEQRWKVLRRELVADLEKDLAISEVSESLDVTLNESWVKDWRFARESALITMSFFLSEVWSFNGSKVVSRFIQRMIDKAPCGMVFCYVDNAGPNFSPLIEEEFRRDDIVQVLSEDYDRLVISPREQASVLTVPFYQRFGEYPKLQGAVAWRVWKKIDA